MVQNILPINYASWRYFFFVMLDARFARSANLLNARMFMLRCLCCARQRQRDQMNIRGRAAWFAVCPSCFSFAPHTKSILPSVMCDAFVFTLERMLGQSVYHQLEPFAGMPTDLPWIMYNIADRGRMGFLCCIKPIEPGGGVQRCADAFPCRAHWVPYSHVMLDLLAFLAVNGVSTQRSQHILMLATLPTDCSLVGCPLNATWAQINDVRRRCGVYNIRLNICWAVR